MNTLYSISFTCDMLPVKGLAGVCGLLGGVTGGWKRRPPSRWMGDWGPRWWLKKLVGLSTESVRIGEGGLSSSDCDLLLSTLFSSSYFDKNACKVKNNADGKILQKIHGTNMKQVELTFKPAVGVYSDTTTALSNRLYAPSRTLTNPLLNKFNSRQYIPW